VTFRNNPAILLEPEGYGGDIQTHLQKMDTLAGMGVGLIILIDFSSDFSKLTGRQFFDILMDRLSLSFIVLGSDFVCGYRGDTSAYDIRTLMKPKGIPVAIIPPILYGGLPVSSTRIREAVRKGDMSSAKAMLGRNYSLDMRGVVSGEEEGEAVIARSAILQAVPDRKSVV
jgi:riboflavin kinase/FMN adenylyltransferase